MPKHVLSHERDRKCRGCGVTVHPPKRYCSHSCSATVTQTGTARKHKKPNGHCSVCQKELPTPAHVNGGYCSNTCRADAKRTLKISAWLAGTSTGFGLDSKTGATPKWLKDYLIQSRGRQCEICSATEWQSQQIPLVMDHISGDSTDNRPENLRLVCGNCDMQLPTYKSKNRGQGRANRRQRYSDGKSY